MQNSKFKLKIQKFDPKDLKKLYIPPSDSHKRQNGKVMIIAGSRLFHAASLWPLRVASRIVDMVYYSSVPENNELVQKAKEEFRDGIIVPRKDIESYIEEADCILIGPGMMRTEEKLDPTEDYDLKNLSELDEIEHEGIQTYYLTKYLLKKYSEKKWVIDGGSLQMMDRDWLISYGVKNAILTPHQGEFKTLFGKDPTVENAKEMAKKYKIVILLKGERDIVCSPFDSFGRLRTKSAQGETCVQVSGGNAGMTKGGTGDVLAGLVASLYCKNDTFLSACAGSYINKKAGESLYERVGPYFNVSDLADEIPKVMRELL